MVERSKDIYENGREVRGYVGDGREIRGYFLTLIINFN